MSNLYVTQTVNGDLQPVKVNGESSALEIAQDEVKVLALEIDGIGICRTPTVNNQIANKAYVDSSGGGSGDMTGVDITAGDGLDITQSGTTSGDYTATLSTDLKSNGGVVIESTELAVDLGASSITGTLAVSDGGTGATTLTSNAVLTGNGTSAVQAEDQLLFASRNLYPTASAHDAAGIGLTVSAGNTTAGTTQDIAGGTLTFEAGRGKGTGIGGDIVFKTANAGSSGHVLNDLATALTISDDLSSTFTGKLALEYDSANYALFSVGSNGDLTISTLDEGMGIIGHITLDADGDVIIDADGGNITLQDGGSTYTPSASSDATTKSYVDADTYMRSSYSATVIKIYPIDFRVNDDYGRTPNMVEDDTADTLGFRVGSTNEEAYAFVPIPAGYSATHVQVHASASTSSAVQCKSFNYSTGATVDLETFALGTNQNITDVDGDSLDLVIKYLGLSTSTLIYGATVTIAAN